MNRPKTLVAIGCIVGAICAATVGVTANAATLYNNIDYSGGIGVSAATWRNPTSQFNDAASSLTNSGSTTYYENINYGGTFDTFVGNVRDLRTKPLRGEDWNDRISSFR